MSTIIEDLSWRYATKKFNNTRKLSPAQINLLKEGFNLTASSFGLQPVTLIIIEDQELRKRLVPHSMNQSQVAEASHLLVFCIETKVDSAYIKNYFDRVKHIRNTPAEILEPFKKYLLGHFAQMDNKAIELWASKQAYLSMGNLLTICATQKIDACPMEGFVPENYDRLLGLEDKGLQSVLIMPVGYRADEDQFASFAKVRKPISEAVIEL